jgi:16S rRNA (cytidine1402-2'-O)-methyltransferase
MGTLYLVATPIGNLEDISARALRVLREVGLIAAEDTRQTRKLLAHFDIHTRMTSYHDHSQSIRLEQVLAALTHQDVALVSDAGTPGLNDPGYEMVRAALKAGYSVSPVPGPSAPIAALVASGLPTDAFLFLGYLPRKQGPRRRSLKEIATQPYTLIFLESPHRFLPALEDVKEILGDREIAVARELTKLHEEIFRGRISAAQAHFSAQPLQGEITLVVAGAESGAGRWDAAEVRVVLQQRLTEGSPPSEIAREVAREAGWRRRDVYGLLVEMQTK